MQEGCSCVGCIAFLIANAIIATVIGFILTIAIIAAIGSAS